MREPRSGGTNDVVKVALSLLDQTTELSFPPRLAARVAQLFGAQDHAGGKPGRHIFITERIADRYAIGGDAKEPRDGLSEGELIDLLLDEIVHSLIDDLDSAVALHAASVGAGTKSVLITGATGAGKTSLAGWFVANGFEFLSDELVLVTDKRGTTLSFPRPLLAKPGAEELIAILRRGCGAETVATASNTAICLDPRLPAKDRARKAGLIIFPRFVAGSELALLALSPAVAGMKLMECNLNARNLADHGLAMLAALARSAPSLGLTYGSFAQLGGVIDALARLILEERIDAASWHKVLSAFRPIGSGAAPASAAQPKFEIPPPTPRKGSAKLTIGMATYDDYDGVYFTLQALRLYHPEIVAGTEFLVIDNHPDGVCAQHLKNLEHWIPNYRYVPKSDRSGTAVRDATFAEASGEFVLCIDCHVFIVPGAIKRLLDYLDADPSTADLLQGPLLYDDLTSISTHFRPEWRAGMFGTWDKNGDLADRDEPFDIPMQGLGLFACRRTAWPGFNTDFRGFGGEEGYIHEKFRRLGARTLCLPFLRWTHRFNRPLGVPYVNRWDDRVRNYLIGLRELGLDAGPMLEHFKVHLGEGAATSLFARIETELAKRPPVPRPTHVVSRELAAFLADCRAILSCDPSPAALEQIALRLKKLIGEAKFTSLYFGDDATPGNHAIHTEQDGAFRFLTHILPARYVAFPHDHGDFWVAYAQVAGHSDVSEWQPADDPAASTDRLVAERQYRMLPGDVRVFQRGAIHSIDFPAGTRYVRVMGKSLGKTSSKTLDKAP
jgi:Glycosyl transferase family 2